MIIGKLLGDGSITKQKGRKPRFQFNHTKTDYGWSRYCYEQLAYDLPLNPPMFKQTIDPRLKEGYSQSYFVQSRTSDVITFLRSQWYSDSIKIIPVGLLSHYFNEQSLAWWYMDDGHLKLNGNKPLKIILSTDNFTNTENNWLINFLREKYNLSFRMDKQNRLILYDQFQINYFLYLVGPYMHGSMHRKFIKSCTTPAEIPATRTTIYLPITIELQHPTKEINTSLKKLDNIIKSFKKGKFYKSYLTRLNSTNPVQTKGYQITLNQQNMSNLQFLNKVTGLTNSKLTELCFDS